METVQNIQIQRQDYIHSTHIFVYDILQSTLNKNLLSGNYKIKR